MARQRMRAAQRRARNEKAHAIGSGVYSIAVQLDGAQGLPFPLELTAPLVYAAEMIAWTVCQRKGWEPTKERLDDMAQYVMQGLQESAVALTESFDGEHFAAWTAAREGERVRLQSGEPGTG
jgi:hypothetical protein